MDPLVVEMRRVRDMAESENPRRELYIRLAELVTEYMVATGAGQRAVATALQRGRTYVRRLLKWKENGYEEETPWATDETVNTRAARSHARRMLSDPDERRRLLEELTPDEARDAIETLVQRDDLISAAAVADAEEFGRWEPLYHARDLIEAVDSDRLDWANELLENAESDDPARQAWINAAENIALHIEKAGTSQKNVAQLIGRSPLDVRRLLAWKRSGYEGMPSLTSVARS